MVAGGESRAEGRQSSADEGESAATDECARSEEQQR